MLKTSPFGRNRYDIYTPPVFLTTGIEPYLMAMSWVSPHGSKIEGTKIKSAPAYI